ncbi:RNA polymerase sigma factor [Mucilaginibacter rubeus]|uniref:RNA polymerase sigma-70 factor n=1 Tax=Mucilaginibacter rubeus TaxID=2027860 RepID=A0A5C1I383_9SPHI|nr:RNA polymerase sigma-70 factor [Mucilaginibacter rubeus]QEM11740.1 RNA polymerase sigma-70 factor [Mucilaginibacter rubeus]
MAYKDLAEKDLISLLQQNDDAAFSEIFNRHWGFAYLHALKLLNDEDEAKDIVQEVFTSIWNQSGSLTGETNLRAYIFSAVRNRTLNHIRDQKVRSEYMDLFAIYCAQHQNIILDAIHEKELLSAINLVIDSLPPRMKEIFELSRTEHLSHKEIADKLDISTGTVKRQISNALYILKDRLDKPENLIVIIFLQSIKGH